MASAGNSAICSGHSGRGNTRGAPPAKSAASARHAIPPWPQQDPLRIRPSRMLAARPEEVAMGFMDKAKKLAEQAQQKLDEAQENFNKSESPQAEPQEGGVRYDEHGRPVEE